MGRLHAATLLLAVLIIRFLILAYITFLPDSCYCWRCSILIWWSQVLEAIDFDMCDNMLYLI
jgi:hypothetical protein